MIMEYKIEVIKDVLNKLVTPMFPELIKDYDVKINKLVNHGTLIIVTVNVYTEVFYSDRDFGLGPIKTLEHGLKKAVEKALKYISAKYVLVHVHID